MDRDHDYNYQKHCNHKCGEQASESKPPEFEKCEMYLSHKQKYILLRPRIIFCNTFSFMSSHFLEHKKQMVKKKNIFENVYFILMFYP